MTLLWILLATTIAGVGSVLVAALLTGGVMQRYTQGMLSFAAGALLSTAFLHLLPEALEAGGDAHHLLAWLLGGLVFFFVLDKAELYHHGHEHGHDHGHDHDHVHDHSHGAAHQNSGAALAIQVPGASNANAGAPAAEVNLKSGSWVVILGDSVHAFGDGILIATAFLADWHLGVLVTLAVAAHEVPHHMGDLAVVRVIAQSARVAVMRVSMAGAVTALGGLVGYMFLAKVTSFLPVVLMLASSSFIYVALADLIPQLQKHHGSRQTVSQLVWLGLGIVVILVASGAAHSH